MQPIVKPLPLWRRKLIFIVLTLAFLLSLPVFVFYATGYRYDIFGESPTITATGGLYISSEAEEGIIYVNEVEVDNARVFRKAAYIQGLEPGLHRVHVQGDGLHTWVKKLRVYPQIVTEAEAFNLPVKPQVRLVTEYTTQNNNPVMVTRDTSTVPFTKASTTLSIATTTIVASSTHKLNPEFVLLEELFADKASTTLRRKTLEEQIEKEKVQFGFATTTLSEAVMEKEKLATTTVISDDLMLYQNKDEIFVRTLGLGKQVPRYFCTKQTATTSINTTGQKVEISEEEVLRKILSASSEMQLDSDGCRKEIRIDRKWQNVHDFTFFPDNTNLVLMHLDDGIYVVEIDDRAWQNVQLLYPGDDLMMLVHSGGIYVKDEDLILEALTELIDES